MVKYTICYFQYNSPSYSRIPLVLTYDVIEDRRTIDIIAKFLLLHFKMAELFEN